MYSAKVPRPPVCLTEPRIPNGSASLPSGPRGESVQLTMGDTGVVRPRLPRRGNQLTEHGLVEKSRLGRDDHAHSIRTQHGGLRVGRKDDSGV